MHRSRLLYVVGLLAALVVVLFGIQSASAFTPVNMVNNPGFESGAGNPATCWQNAGYGTNTRTFTKTTDSHSGTYAMNLNVSAWTDGDAKVLTSFSGSCSPAVIPGHSYTITAWYKSNTNRDAIILYKASAVNGTYSWWKNGAINATASSYTQVTYNTGTIPAGTGSLAVGFLIPDHTGIITVDDFTMTDDQAAPAPHDTSISGTAAYNASEPVSDSTASSAVYNFSTWEPSSVNNYTADHTTPSGSVSWSDDGYPADSFPVFAANRAYVTGNHTGTTDEIIQWAAAKWGIDPDLMRAVAVQETDWDQSNISDTCDPNVTGEGSYGLFQVKNNDCTGSGAWGGYPDTANETALNADFYASVLRTCLQGGFPADQISGMYDGESVSQDITDHGYNYVIWGCVGFWFSGDWYSTDASDYISSVQSHLANLDYLNE